MADSMRPLDSDSSGEGPMIRNIWKTDLKGLKENLL